MFDKSTYFPQLGIFEAKQQLGSFAANHDFHNNGTFAIDLFFFRCLPLSNKELVFSSIDLSRNAFLGFIGKAAADWDCK